MYPFKAKRTEVAVLQPVMNIEKAREMMREKEIDAIIVNSPHHVFYTSGFRCFDQIIAREAEAYVIIPADKGKDACLVAPHSDRFILRDFPTWVKKKRLYSTFYIKGSPECFENKVEKPIDGILQHLNELHLATGRIAIEERALSICSYEKIKKRLPRAEFVNGTDLLKELRIVKTEEEIARIKQATRATETAIYAVIEAAKAGMSELELSSILMHAMIGEGASVFYVQIGAGERGAYGAGTYPTERKLKEGDIVRVDASAEYEGYLSDICKNFAVGKASDLARKYYDITFEAEQTAMMTVRPLVKASEIFHAGVEVPKKAGYSDFYRHHVGHGIGLEAHEAPMLSAGNNTEIVPGMVLCVETPYYVWNLGGFAPEDTILVTGQGYELLTTPERELRVV